MFALWPGLFIQAVPIERALERVPVPHAMFSPTAQLRAPER